VCVCVTVHNNVVIGSGAAWVELRVGGQLSQDGAARTRQALQMAVASWWSIAINQESCSGRSSRRVACGVPLGSDGLPSPLRRCSPQHILAAWNSFAGAGRDGDAWPGLEGGWLSNLCVARKGVCDLSYRLKMTCVQPQL